METWLAANADALTYLTATPQNARSHTTTPAEPALSWATWNVCGVRALLVALPEGAPTFSVYFVVLDASGRPRATEVENVVRFARAPVVLGGVLARRDAMSLDHAQTLEQVRRGGGRALTCGRLAFLVEDAHTVYERVAHCPLNERVSRAAALFTRLDSKRPQSAEHAPEPAACYVLYKRYATPAQGGVACVRADVPPDLVGFACDGALLIDATAEFGNSARSAEFK